MKLNIKNIAKEIAKGLLILFVLSTAMSYFKSPNLDFENIPNLEVKLLDGTTYKQEKDKPLVIHFWAKWCKICKLEIQNIEELSKNYNVLTIAVNSGSNDELKSYMKEKNLSFKVINDIDSKWAKKFKVEAFPTTFIYNSKSELKFTEVGYTTTAGLLTRMKLLD